MRSTASFSSFWNSGKAIIIIIIIIKRYCIDYS